MNLYDRAIIFKFVTMVLSGVAAIVVIAPLQLDGTLWAGLLFFILFLIFCLVFSKLFRPLVIGDKNKP
jgi:hypothetical protein